VQAKETVVADLMQGRAQQFQVPLYQRTYSWSEKQLEQLWSDILEQADLLSTGGDGSTHFLGSVVLAPSPLNEATFPRWLVVDGQQRLTTLSLALAAIRDHREAMEPEEAERIGEDYLINKRRRADEFFRLLPTQADRAAYAAHVNGTQGAHGGESRIAAAYRFFQRKLVEASDPADPTDIGRIEEAITSRLTLVAVTAEKGDNVHRIFESLNNTGLKLSQADLLRNYLFMRLPTRGEHVYETYWLPLQQSLTNDQLEQLMWLHLVVDGNDRVRRQDLYTAQQQRFERDGWDEETIEAYIKELYRRSIHFARVVHPEREPDPRVRDVLRRLDTWQASVTYPAVMLLLDRQERGELDTPELVRALSYIESFLVRRAICWVPTNNLNRIFMSVPAQMPVGVPAAEGIRQLLSANNRFWPSDEELREAVRTVPFYQRARNDQRKLVLQRLEESYGHPEPVDFASAKLTIEHVMPQSPGDEWLEMLREDCPDGETPEELHARLQHTLGNLTLSAINSELSNHPFERKQGLLAGSHLEMNRRIAETPRWGATEILARSEELADRAVQLWPGPVRGVARVERGRNWQMLHQVLAALPYGTWTTYGNAASFIGSGAQAVGAHLANTDGVVNAHRVLNSEGRVSEGFRWGAIDHGDVRDLLASEGIRFTAAGMADRAQQLSAQDLADLYAGGGADRDSTDDDALPAPSQATAAAPAAAATSTADAGAAGMGEEGRERFFRQLEADNDADCVAAVREIVEFWEAIGGWTAHGWGEQTSAFLMLGGHTDLRDGIWPFRLTPGTGRGGLAVVAFMDLAERSPFDGVELREELRARLNRIDGVEISEGKLALRPSFRLDLLADEEARKQIFETLAWFRDRCAGTEESVA
jgi:alkylated DNA nucleotide flippase Atl1